MDKLEHIFYLQFKLQKKLGVIKQIKNDSDKQQFINLNILAIFEEAVEIIKESAYKNPKVIKFGWKKGQKHLINKKIGNKWNFPLPGRSDTIIDERANLEGRVFGATQIEMPNELPKLPDPQKDTE